MKERLIQFEADCVGETYLQDFLTIVAQNIETSFLQSGAEPGKDYNYRDLFQLAVPFVRDHAKWNQLKWTHNGLEGTLGAESEKPQ
jgi:hypothetical protein